MLSMDGCGDVVVVEVPTHNIIPVVAVVIAVVDGVPCIRWHCLAAVRGVRLTSRDVEDLRFHHGVAFVSSRASIKKERFVEKSW